MAKKTKFEGTLDLRSALNMGSGEKTFRPELLAKDGTARLKGDNAWLVVTSHSEANEIVAILHLGPCTVGSKARETVFANGEEILKAMRANGQYADTTDTTDKSSKKSKKDKPASVNVKEETALTV